MSSPARAAFLLLLALVIFALVPTGASGADPASPAPLLSVMEGELHRAQAELGKLDPPPYYLSYTVYDQDFTVIAASQGALLASTQVATRRADVVLHTGSTALDNTHDENRSSGISSGFLPRGEDRDAIARSLWRLTYEQYRRAERALANVKTQTAVRAKEDDDSPDFSQEAPQNFVTPFPARLDLNRAEWEARLRRYSGLFRSHPEVEESAATLLVEDTRSHFVSSEGSRLATPEQVVRLQVMATARADDGMELLRVETFQAATPEKLPSDAEITARAEKMAADLKTLRIAPLAEPATVPALLSGRAAAVFFHEVLGHRLEGHRQRGDDEGQTFTRKVNEAVLPDFLSVADDPTLRELNGVELGGWYRFDDEGMPARRVEVIQKGILKNFLMSRIPVKNFSQSNGHGRSQGGLMPIGRQGNLIVSSTHTVPDAQMRQQLQAEVRKQGKPYGLYFEDIQGGFTLTSRAAPQAFQVLPVMVWKVYADNRPDELVRGVDIVGTPLAALNRILVTGDTQAVFNGICGAESGQVAVAAAAPAMLFSEIEVQKRAHEHMRPPILPPPGADQAPATGVSR
jgi:predicted Zn-dependent protease